MSGLSAWSMTLRERIASTRFGFTRYPGSGSNLDEEVRFDSWRAMACYVPRALVIGFFAPFPQMWFVSGAEVGRTGRLLAGVETASMYVVELLTLMALWRNRRQASAWFLAALATAGMACLGLVVANVGALYRMRYGFWILLIVIAASQMIQLQSNVTRTQKA